MSDAVMQMPELEQHSEVDWGLIIAMIHETGLPCVGEVLEFMEELVTRAKLTPHQLMATAILAKPLLSQPGVYYGAIHGDWRLALGLGLSFSLKMLEETRFWLSDLQIISPYLHKAYAIEDLLVAEQDAFGVVDLTCLDKRLQELRDQIFLQRRMQAWQA